MSVSNFAERLVIAASHAMSLYCYSILRLDPYVGCSHGCLYCYTRFLPSFRAAPKPLREYPKLLSRTFKALKGTPVLSMPFRLSALTDPLQPLERIERITLATLDVVRRYSVPTILSTKSDYVALAPWLDPVKELAGEGKLIVQITLTNLDEAKSKILEPGAPPPEKRLRAMEVIASEGVPVVVRLQPIIPHINDGVEELEELLTSAAAAGAKQVIAECYRFSSWSDLDRIARAGGPLARKLLLNSELWERAVPGTHKRPVESYRVSKYEELRELTRKRGLLFSTCREPFFWLETAPNCCGIHMMKGYRLKPTLREVARGCLDRRLYVTKGEVALTVRIERMKRKLLEHYELLERYHKEIGGGKF